MSVPDELLRETFPWEEYVLARSLVPELSTPSQTSPSTTCSQGCGVQTDVDRRRSDVSVHEGWLDGWVGRGHAPGGSGAVQVVVMGLPDGDATWQVRLDDGVVAEVAPGAREGRRASRSRCRRAIADEVADGETTASAAFMQGRMKTAGDLGLVLDVLAAVDSRS